MEVRKRPPSTLRSVDSGPREVPEMEVRERPPTTLRNIDGGPREVLELEILEHPPSMLRNVDSGPPGGARAGLGFEGTQCLWSPPLAQGGEWL
jgi:hypothetical protein